MENTTTQTQQNTSSGEDSGGQETQRTTPALFDEPEEHEETRKTEERETEAPETEKPEEGQKPLTKEDIAVPEGFTYDEELGKGFLDIVNDGKLNRKELAEKLVGMYSAQQTRMLSALAEAEKAKAEQFEADMKREKEDWMKQCQADGEFGGQKWEAAQAVIDRGCKQVATPEAVGLMQKYNLNTHPEIVRMFYRAGLLAGEDRGGGNGGGNGKIDYAEAIFGESLRGAGKNN